MTRRDVVVGAYAALSPEDAPTAAAAFVESILGLDDVDGLEIPLGLAGDEQWFQWAGGGGRHVVTAVPALAVRTRARAGFGLASADRRGRRAAIAVIAGMHEQLVRWREHGRVVTAVALSSGVPGSGAVAARLTESLREIRSWDWGGTAVVIEHCDAVGGAGAPDKGYARLHDERAAVERSDHEGAAPSGLVVNWGRSAIEFRDVSGAAVHAEQAGERLFGFMLSGVSGEDGPYGPAWTDAHPPVVDTVDPSVSLLTREHAVEALASLAHPPAYVGVKTAWRPAGDRLEPRIAAVRRALDLLRTPTSGRTP